MDISIESSGLKRVLKITQDANSVNDSYKKELKSIKQNASIKGFRPGKVKFDFLVKKYGPSVKQKILSDLIESTWTQVVKEQKFKPVASPIVDLVAFDFDAQQDVVIKYEFEVEPEFELLDLSNILFTKLEYEISRESVYENLEKLRLSIADKNEVDRPSALGDELLVSYKRTLDGQDQHFEKQDILLSDDAYLPEFVKNIVGLKKEDKKSFTVTYPQDWSETELVGKTVDIDLTVLSVQEVIPASNEKLKENFLNNIHATDEELLAKIESLLKQAVDTRAFEENKERIIEALKNAHQIEVPQSLMPKDVQDQADRDDLEAIIKLGIILNRYLAEHDIKIDNKAYFEHIAKQADRYGVPIHVFFDFLKSNQKLVQDMRYELLINALVTKILAVYPSDRASEKVPYDTKK